MVWGESVCTDGLAMFFRWISLVLFPVVHRVFRVKRFHIGVTIGLCQHRRGGNAYVFAIAFYDAFMGNFFIAFKTIAVYNDEFRCDGQLIYGLVHGHDSRIEDIDFVDFLRMHMGDPEASAAPLDQRSKKIPAFVREQF